MTQGYDAQVAMTLRLVVRADVAHRHDIRPIARAFAAKFADTLQMLDGDDYGDARVTEFSLEPTEGGLADAVPFNDHDEGIDPIQAIRDRLNMEAANMTRRDLRSAVIL